MINRWLLFLIIAVLVSIYVYSYFLHPGDISVLQTTASAFNPMSLLEKQPVVIQDASSDFLSFIASTWTFTRQPTNVMGEQWNKNKYKHMVIYANGPCEVLVCPATAKRDHDGSPVNDAMILAFKMSPNQAIIIPFHWSFYTESIENLTLIGIHDYVTFFLP